MREQLTFARTQMVRPTGGSFRSPEARKSSSYKTHLSSGLDLLTTQALTKEVQSLVLQFPTAQVVEDTQASIRAIENVRNGESGMSLKTFVNLCRANPRARALVGPLLGFGCETDPNVVQAISVLMNQLVREPAADDDPPAPMHGDLFEPMRGGNGRD